MRCSSCGQVVEDFLAALESRSLIGQAQGILMCRYDMNASQAWDVLRRYSNNTNTRMRDLAFEVAAVRSLPDYLL